MDITKSPVHLTEGELATARELIERGELPKDAIERHYECEARNVYGHDAKKDAAGNWIPQSIPLGHNHYAAILRYEGKDAYDRAVRNLWRENPQRAKALNLPEPPRAGA